MTIAAITSRANPQIPTIATHSGMKKTPMEAVQTISTAVGVICALIAALSGLVAWQAGERIQAKKDAALAQATSRVSQLEQKNETLEKRFAPRHLSDDQATSITDYLKSRPPGTVKLMSFAGDPEGADFAGQLAKAIESGGWTVNRASSIPGPTVPRGMGLIAQHERSVPGIALRDSLEQAGFILETNLNANLQPNDVQLIVGAKPETP